MSLPIDGGSFVRAVKHPANCKPIIFCSASLIGMGGLLVVLGVTIMLLDHIELGPPHFDNEFNRYSGSNLSHIVGPMLIGFGSLVVTGNIVLLGYTTKYYYYNTISSTDKPASVSAKRQDRYVQV